MVKGKTPAKTEKNLEREYTIPLRSKYKHVARYKKTPKAVKSIKEFLVKHMKVYDRDLRKIKIDKLLNEALWFRGIKKPPHKIKVKATKDVNGIVLVELADLTGKLKFKKLREDKKLLDALESTKKQKTAEDVAKKQTEAEVPEKTEEEKKEEEKVEAEKKTTEKEKVAAGAEATKVLEKTAAKQAKQQKQPKVKQPKHPQRKSLAK